jgi:hypothetical protein
MTTEAVAAAKIIKGAATITAAAGTKNRQQQQKLKSQLLQKLQVF